MPLMLGNMSYITYAPTDGWSVVICYLTLQYGMVHCVMLRCITICNVTLSNVTLQYGT